MKNDMDAKFTSIAHFLQDQYEFEVEHIKEIDNGVINSNFFVACRGNEYICRIYNSRSQKEVQFETDVLEFLAEYDFPCPHPLHSKNKEIIASFEERPCIVYPYIRGSQLKIITSEILHSVGKLMGTLHVHLQKHSPKIHKTTWEPFELEKLVERGRGEIVTTYSHGETIIEFVEQELPKYEFPDTLPVGVTHQDIKPENIIVDNGRIKALIDFDNGYVGALLHDITTTIIWTCFKNDKLNKNYVKALVEGYESVRKFTKEEHEHLMSSIKYRLVRECFIGPYVTQHAPILSEKRAFYFMQLYTVLQTPDK